MYLLIGSVAAAANGVDLGREAKDMDVLCAPESRELLAARLRVDTVPLEGFNDLFPTSGVATIDQLYTIKHSHAYWDLRGGSWPKHMADLLKLEAAGGKLDLELHDILYKQWELKHGKKQVDLTQEAEEFFSDAVPRLYVHDSIHDSVAYGDRPIYEECLKDGHSVLMDMAKVWALPFERQLNMFREEIYVTALERLVIPSGYRHSPGAAYQWALRRTITSLTKGRSARFLVSHFKHLTKPDMDYVAHHRSRSDRLIPLKEDL